MSAFDPLRTLARAGNLRQEMAREQFFVASAELVSDVMSTWRAAGATFVRSTYTGQSGAQVASPEADLAEGHALRFFIYDASPSSIKLHLESVKTDDGELRSYVQQRYGSPYIDFHFIKARQMGDVVVAGHGSLAIYPYYYDVDTKEKIKPSDRLVELFRSAGLRIRKQSNVTRSLVVPKMFFVEKEIHQRGCGEWFDYRISPVIPTH